MSTWQALRLVVLPQAVRRILPPLGNDFIAMLKDSSLVSTVGVRDITQQAKLYASATFQYRETYSTLAFIYLSLTLMLSLVVKWLEQHMAQGEADD
jgi:polar amino acid transport system permease protein